MKNALPVMQEQPVETRPWVFNHRYGKMTVHASSEEQAVEKATLYARGMPLVPAFSTADAS